MPRNLTEASTMDGSYFTGQLTSNAGRFEALVQGVSEAQARWKPDAETWSILAIVNPLYDEEREDFRVRLDNILHHQEREWAPIDPEGWVTERQYSERELPASLQSFLIERSGSLKWLESLGSPDWETLYTSEYGSMRAGDMFTS
jgi:streptomycin 6-kinase